MSVYLKVLPAILLEPDVLLKLGQSICMIVRESLILDRRMDELCTALEREGRTLKEVINRNNRTPNSAYFDEAAIACEKACALLKAGIQLYVLHQDPVYRIPAQKLLISIDCQGRHLQKSGYNISNDRIRDIIVNLESPQMQQALTVLKINLLYNDLKESYTRLESIRFETECIDRPEQMPTLRSTIALYGMLIDTLIANVRFENYQMLHRVESVLLRIEAAVSDAMTKTVSQSQPVEFLLKQQKSEPVLV